MYIYIYIYRMIYNFLAIYKFLLVCIYVCEEFRGRDRPRQLALNGSTTEYVLKNLVHDTEYVLSLYVLFGSVVGPGITATFRTCEWPDTLSCFLDKHILTVIIYIFALVVRVSCHKFCSLAPLGYVSNFKVTSYTSSSIDVEWSPIVGATEYKLTWGSGTIWRYFL